MPDPRPVTTLLLLAAILAPARGLPLTTRVFFGDSAHPVVAGEAWLVADRWGTYPAVLVATIRDGKLTERDALHFPEYWEQAFDYRLILAVATRPVRTPAALVEDFGYGAIEAPEYLKRFSVVYLSPPLTAEKLGNDWPSALENFGHLNGTNLILAAPGRRKVRLLYPGGAPLAGERVPVSLFGSSENHCGVAVGIHLGVFTTNAEGELAVVAPNSSLALGIGYFEEQSDGPAGTAFYQKQVVIVGGDAVTTVKHLWTLDKHDYIVRLRTAENQPIAHAHLTGCIYSEGCGSGCGPVNAPESDAYGTIRFRGEDLRVMRSLTVVSESGKERDLTDSELIQLLSNYGVSLRWDLRNGM